MRALFRPKACAASAIALAGLGLLAAPAVAYTPANFDRFFGDGGVIVSPQEASRIQTQHDLVRDAAGTRVGIERTPSAAGCGYTIRLSRFVSSNGAVEGSTDLPVDAPCSAPIPSQVAVGADGLRRLYVAIGDGSSIRLTRLREDGSVDSGFGQEGTMVIATPQPLLPEQLDVSPEGGLLLAGEASLPGGHSADTFLARLRPDGSFDPGFRGGGISLFDAGLGEATPQPSALAVARDGEIYLAGPLSRTSAGHQWVPPGVRAFLPDGAPDRGFGRMGFAKLRGTEAPAMALFGEQLFVGSGEGARQASVVRLTRAGRLDRSFGRNGAVGLSPRGGFHLSELAVDGSSRIVLAGTTGCCGPTQRGRFAVLRLEPDGSADRTFAGGKLFRLGSTAAASGGEIAVEGLDVSSGNAGGGILVAGSVRSPCSRNCSTAPSSEVRFRLEGQTSHERCQGRRATIVGSSRGEALAGTKGADVIAGLGGNDRIFGRGGNDVICGGRGRDVLRGGPGRNSISQS
jgi:uncharacterized delta-60 repeat protein